MPKNARDYFRYFPSHPDLATWGIGVVACGSAVTAPGAPYPPHRHPADHHFDWSHGRVLESLQIVHIEAGQGTLEVQSAAPQLIAAGSAFLLPPGIWHRYQPDPATGWKESWVELRGPVLDNLCKADVLTASSLVRPTAIEAGMDAAFESLHHYVRQAEPGFAPELSALALAIVATWARAGQIAPARAPLARAVQQAERYLTEHHTEAVNIAELARRLGVAYSHFRREFKAQTGYSPWSYVVHLRLSRARRLLAASDATLDDVAARLGFSSAFHLSSSFKKVFGESPRAWRSRLRQGG